ncbi:MAG: DUF2336 domain-containing protein [Alphaproteobacteria bacterium]|nr:DUF2336 domain-containing protein [Alphaproteobacteria bacterium]
MSAALKLDEAELAALQRLARQRNAGARQDLFTQMGELALGPAGQLAPTVKHLLDEILLTLVSEVETKIRAELAARMAGRKDVPEGLLRHLACDDIEVARPLLLNSEALREEDLIAVIRAGETAHRETIAARRNIPATVCSALIEAQEPSVDLALVQNLSAHPGAAVLAVLAARSEGNEALRRPLLLREDLPGEAAQAMFWWVSAALRRNILERFPMTEKLLDETLGSIAADEAAHRRRLPPPRGSSVNELLKSLRAGEMSVFMQNFSALLQTTRATAKKILQDSGGEALAIAARAIGANRTEFTSLVLLTDYKRFGRARPTGHLEHVAHVYDLIGRDQAQLTVQYWDRQSRPQAA